MSDMRTNFNSWRLKVFFFGLFLVFTIIGFLRFLAASIGRFLQ